MCFMSDMSTMGSALDNAVIPRYDAGMNPMDKRELYETTADICSSFRWSTCLPGFQAFAATVKVPKLLAPAGLPDTPIGSISAPVTLIEYSSPTCSHCVEYRTRVAPRIHAEFVTTGKVRSIFRPFVRHNVDLVIFMLGEWQGGTKREEVIASFYRGGMSFDEMKAVITSLETSQNWSERK
ncbi:thioredoxin domain-containing protein [Sinorhizobium meliloti]|nr:hypothetical protein CDO22_24940 [Sinorhizobium meliloti]MDW9370836.1 thioredoxin domain-containing protein [Sinorhizobium meliloti]MDW9401195.1 thioredoxin domain-containing protein [Sinorhizobium meliloti]MDW9450161.1 thioredoxin domain-containing protein [Sinorhizobium meliloti]MDW9663146.1 thioredoxin domain-containing protein [Sinorhizobium meliloti]